MELVPATRPSTIVMLKALGGIQLVLPARLCNARKQPAESMFPETNPAHTEPAHKRPASTTESAPVVLLSRKLRRSLRLDDQ